MADPTILIIQLKRAGDVIVTTPVFPALKAAYPGVQIDVLVDKPFAPLLEHNPYLRSIQLYDRGAVLSTWRRIRETRYTWIFDFQSSPRSVMAGMWSGAAARAGYNVPFWGRFFSHRISRPGRTQSVVDGKMSVVKSLVPAIGKAGERRVFLTPEERTWAAGQLSVHSTQIIGIIPTHRRESRRWGGNQFATLAERFSKRGYEVWWFWGPGEEAYVDELQKQVPNSLKIPKTSLREMAALLERCRLIVTNDNGPMHLAVAVGRPTVTIYGPTEPTSWNPGGPLHRFVQAQSVSCLGCNLNECPFQHECMRDLSPEQVDYVCMDQLQRVVGSNA